MGTGDAHQEAEQAGRASIPGPADGAAESPPWEEIAIGRFMPRRIRGSCRGRELG